jgi:hypothetical protein
MITHLICPFYSYRRYQIHVVTARPWLSPRQHEIKVHQHISLLLLMFYQGHQVHSSLIKVTCAMGNVGYGGKYNLRGLNFFPDSRGIFKHEIF